MTKMSKQIVWNLEIYLTRQLENCDERNHGQKHTHKKRKKKNKKKEKNQKNQKNTETKSRSQVHGMHLA